MLFTEVWKDIPGYEGLYQASTTGLVRSLPRLVTEFDPRTGKERTKRLIGKVLKFGPGKYPNVSLSKNGTVKTREVHRWVLETFIGPCPEGLEACHWDGDRWNNSLDNLRWDTRTNNHADNVRNGTRMYGDKNPSFGKYNCHAAKLSEDQVKDLLEKWTSGSYKQTELASLFGVSPALVSLTVRGRCWKHLRQEV